MGKCGKGGAYETPISSFAMRLLLCRPEGGLNDILSEIGKCMKYCDRYDCKLIVETDTAMHVHFKDSIAHYFTSTNPNYIFDAADYRSQFDHLTVRPPSIQGRVNDYSKLDRSKVAVTFDFNVDHSELLLVHHQNGRQKKRNAIYALSNLVLNAELSSALKQRLEKLGNSYTAYHVRSTDYQTDFKQGVLKTAASISGPIFLATDNIDVVTFFETVFGSQRLFHFSDLPSEAGQPVHYAPAISDMRQRNTDAILDLFTLALAKTYFFFPRIMKSFQILPSYSGFSSLAARLRAQPEILQHALPRDFLKPSSKAAFFRNLRWRYF